MRSNAIYNQAFYADRNNRTKYAAEAILSQVLSDIPDINSAIDIGCGVGTWLNVLQQYGVKEIQGVDGPWVESTQLKIPLSCFKSFDFKKGIEISFNKRFHLAICLEVAEHIEFSMANQFVQFLCNLSDIILFSAAVPSQGGYGHVNEQWPSYWVRLFAERGYKFKDTLRARFWNDSQIPWWYRQNVMLFTSQDKLANVTNNSDIELAALPLVHPELLRQKTEIYTAQAFKTFVGCVIRALRHKIAKTTNQCY